MDCAEISSKRGSSRMGPEVEERLAEIKNRFVKAFNPYQIILFGSHVYGSPGPDSDVDLLIVMESDLLSVQP